MEIWPGEGCDSAYLGVCQYPRLAYNWDRKLFRPDFARYWSFRSSCKTQYASEFGWDHFLRCHKQVLSLLEFWQHLGATVEVNDEGRYWGTNSEDYLRSLLGSYNRLLAVCGGAMKDAAEATGSGLRVDAPIFKRPDFERLEHEGWQEIKADPTAYLTGSRGKDRQR